MALRCLLNIQDVRPDENNLAEPFYGNVYYVVVEDTTGIVMHQGQFNSNFSWPANIANFHAAATTTIRNSINATNGISLTANDVMWRQTLGG